MTRHMDVGAGTRTGLALRFQRPSLPAADRIERHLARSREVHWLSNGGPCWQLLRDALAERTGSYCAPVASGTVGLMAALAAVRARAPARAGANLALLPSFTFPATAQAALWAGLAPHLLDVDSAHWHLAPDQLEHELSERGDAVAVVIAVSSFGTPPPPEVRRRWEAACRSADVPLVVDSAAGFGAVAADGVPIGAQGDVEVVSFHATKPFAIGEGGAVFTRDSALCERIELAINFGLGADRCVELPLSLNGKMSELHAATGLAVLEEFDAALDARRAAAERLRAAADQSLSWQGECERSTWQFLPAAHPDPASRAVAERRCRDLVETRAYYLPLHRMHAFRTASVASGGLVQTEALASRVLCLPMASDLTAAEQATLARLVASDSPAPAPATQSTR
jgi:dTDP-4-amino-4,6-dideoxygalactose transaminase